MSLYHNRQGLDCLIRALQNYLDEARAEAERRPLQPFPALKEAESDLAPSAAAARAPAPIHLFACIQYFLSDLSA